MAQVCQLEIEGIKMVVKGGLEAAKFIFKAVKALLEHSKKKAQELHAENLEKVGGKIIGRLKETGNKTMTEIMELSKDGLPQMLYIPEDKAKEIYESLQKNKVRFYIPPDLDPTDGKIPVMLPPQDMPMASAVVKPFMEEKLSVAQKAINEYTDQIAELKEKIITAKPEEKADLRRELDHLMQGKREMEETMENIKTDISNNCGGSFADYLKQGKGTEFEKDPEKAIAEYEKGVEIGKKFPIDECMQPVRDRVMMPESKMSFYVPDQGVQIEREFKRDQGAKTIYSEYTLKTNDGEVFHFSDANYTKDEWNEKVLPKILDKAGVIEKTECRVFDTKERMTAYMNYFNQVTPKSEEKLTNAEAIKNKGFSNADVLKEAESTAVEEMKGKTSAKINKDILTVTVPKDRISMKDGKLLVSMEDGTEYAFPRADKPLIKNHEMVFSIKNTDQVVFYGMSKNPTIMPAKDALDQMNSIKEAAIKVRTAALKK